MLKESFWLFIKFILQLIINNYSSFQDSQELPSSKNHELGNKRRKNAIVTLSDKFLMRLDFNEVYSFKEKSYKST